MDTEVTKHMMCLVPCGSEREKAEESEDRFVRLFDTRREFIPNKFFLRDER